MPGTPSTAATEHSSIMMPNSRRRIFSSKLRELLDIMSKLSITPATSSLQKSNHKSHKCIFIR